MQLSRVGLFQSEMTRTPGDFIFMRCFLCEMILNLEEVFNQSDKRTHNELC